MKILKCLRTGCLTMLVILGLPLAFWIGCEVFHMQTSNPRGASSYREYRDRLPPPRWAEKMEKDGKTYFAAAGPIRAPLALPSGPPVCVFDANGIMVDWTVDEGDDGRFQKAWSGFEIQKLTVEELDTIMEKVEQNAAHIFQKPRAVSENGER